MLSELEAAAIEAAMKLLVEAVVQKKLSPEDVTKQVQEMIWKALREAV